jgi:hypothetical protein
MNQIEQRALKVRNIIDIYSALSELHGIYAFVHGRRASLCSALAPGHHIPRLWRYAERDPESPVDPYRFAKLR